MTDKEYVLCVKLMTTRLTSCVHFERQRIPLIKSTKDGKLIEGDFDAVIIVAIEASSAYIPVTSPCHKYLKFIEDVKEHDEYLEKEGGLILLPAEHKNRRLIYSPVGRVNRDFDDIRRFRDAALRGIKRAMKAGSVSPIIGIPFANSHSITYPLYDVAIVLGAFEAIYTVRFFSPILIQFSEHVLSAATRDS